MIIKTVRKQLKRQKKTLKFWGKTYLYRFMPGGYGYYRYLQRQADSEYDWERDKHPVRQKHNKQGGWKQEKEGEILHRDYEDYQEYVTHQQQKYEEVLKIKGGFEGKKIFDFRCKFYARFKHLCQLLPASASIVCAGARQGTEVEVLRDLGFINAYGIDLNPGPHNPYVREGDFMKMENPTSSLDLVYTNCLDHAFNLDGLFAEHARVIRPEGYVCYDMSLSDAADLGAFESVAWENEESLFLMMLRYFQQVIHLETEKDWKWVLLQGKRHSESDES